MQKDPKKVMTVQTVNPRIVAFEYAVRGELAIRAEEIKSVCLSFQIFQALGRDLFRDLKT